MKVINQFPFKKNLSGALLKLTLCVAVFMPTNLWAEDKITETKLYSERVSFWDTFLEVPSTSWDTLKMSFTKKSVPYWSLILGSTALLYHYDEDLLTSEQKRGRDWGIGNADNTKPIFRVAEWDVRFPSDTGSAMYFIGDGWTHFIIAGSLIGTGYFGNHLRPFNTGMQIIHGMTVSTIFSQILKRASGRESPYVKTEYRGRWRPFPSIDGYMTNIPKYDAMPSGHIMTTTMTFTVLMENYPEYRHILLPTEIVCLTLLGWQMVNNGVHWASDYPLGIALGYVSGKAAAKLGRKKNKDESADTVSWNVFPGLSQGVSTMNLIVSY